MAVGIKDAVKLIGVYIICCCAVLVCTMFLNYNLDLVGIKGLIDSPASAAMYDAQVMTSKVVILVTGGCLLATSVVTLIFYIKQFIDSHKKELGILKALGYSEARIAGNFWVFGLCVLLGTATGFALAYVIMPKFYEIQNSDNLLPVFTPSFHAELLVYFVILPTLALGAVAVVYAYVKLRCPVIGLLKGKEDIDAKRDFKVHKRIFKHGKRDIPFLKSLKSITLRSKKSLVFFICFASFCFSAMVQMSVSMKELASEMMETMMMVIGLVLAVTTLLLAIATVIKRNAGTVALMRANGYSQKECVNAVFGGYRPFAYAGFAVGTVYQYGLLKIMVAVVFKDIGGVPDYSFDWKTMLIVLSAFVVFYEAVMLICAEKIRRIPLKSIMCD